MERGTAFRRRKVRADTADHLSRGSRNRRCSGGGHGFIDIGQDQLRALLQKLRDELGSKASGSAGQQDFFIGQIGHCHPLFS